MKRGALITVEGAEGVGKSTCLAAIEAYLLKQQTDIVLTREPGGTELGEYLREWILNGDHGALSAEVEVLLMFAARAKHLDDVIRPALMTGRWVVCDRFTDATRAYQGAGRGASGALIENLSREIHGDLTPDLTLLLDAPVDVGFERIKDRDHDHFEREGRAFFERVRQGYLRLAANEPGRIKVVNADQPIERVEAEIVAQLEAFQRSFNRARR